MVVMIKVESTFGNKRLGQWEHCQFIRSESPASKTGPTTSIIQKLLGYWQDMPISKQL